LFCPKFGICYPLNSNAVLQGQCDKEDINRRNEKKLKEKKKKRREADNPLLNQMKLTK
jgi:hypothetical protein